MSAAVWCNALYLMWFHAYWQTHVPLLYVHTSFCQLRSPSCHQCIAHSNKQIYTVSMCDWHELMAWSGQACGAINIYVICCDLMCTWFLLLCIYELSISLSVRLANTWILTPHERLMLLVLWHEEWLMRDVPLYLKFWTKVTHPLQKRHFPIYICS